MFPNCDDILRPPKKAVLYIRQQLEDTKLLVHFLVVVFATSSWADINGLWVELPLFVLEAPEGWDLPSYITIISQVANVGPLLFVCISILLPRTKHKLEKYTSFGIIVIGTLSSFLLAFFWHETSYIGGTKHSTALLILNFFLALGDCTSSVCFYAFMSLLKPKYMASLFFGEGLSGMLPALIALGQGAGDIVCVNKSVTTNQTFPNGTEHNVTTYSVYPEYVEPNFSVQVFFFTLSVILASSGVAFLLLNILPTCKSEMVGHAGFDYEEFAPGEHSNSDNVQQSQQRRNRHRNNYGTAEESSVYNSLPHHKSSSSSSASEDAETNFRGLNERESEAASDNGIQSDQADRQTTSSAAGITSRVLRVYLRLPNISLFHFITLLTILVIINLTLTSFLGTIQIYSTLPYGLQPYHLTTTLVAIANPTACFGALLFMTKSLVAISSITLLGLVGVVYIIYLAVMSPTPPLHGQDSGAVIAVGTWILTTLLLIYAKVCVAGVMRQHGRNALIWSGVATQVGSLIGAMVGFIMTQNTTVFVQAKFC